MSSIYGQARCDICSECSWDRYTMAQSNFGGDSWTCSKGYYITWNHKLECFVPTFKPWKGKMDKWFGERETLPKGTLKCPSFNMIEKRRQMELDLKREWLSNK